MIYCASKLGRSRPLARPGTIITPDGSPPAVGGRFGGCVGGGGSGVDVGGGGSGVDVGSSGIADNAVGRAVAKTVGSNVGVGAFATTVTSATTVESTDVAVTTKDD